MVAQVNILAAVQQPYNLTSPLSEHLFAVIGPGGVQWVLDHLVEYQVADTGLTFAQFLQERGLSNLSALDKLGFVLEGSQEEMALYLLLALIPARQACKLFKAPGLLSEYTDDQLESAGIYSCLNLVMADAGTSHDLDSPENMADFDTNGLDLGEYHEPIRYFILDHTS